MPRIVYSRHYNIGFFGLIYPFRDVTARDRVDCDIPLDGRWAETDYLRELQGRLPGFLDSVAGRRRVGLAIYNAGTDVFMDDPLGGLRLTAEAVLRRDLFVVGELRKRSLPTLMLLSGGYTPVSYKLVADSVIRLLEAEDS